jgi:hypothetical protein
MSKKTNPLSTECLRWAATRRGYRLIARRTGFELSNDEQLYLTHATSASVARFLLESDVRA